MNWAYSFVKKKRKKKKRRVFALFKSTFFINRSFSNAIGDFTVKTQNLEGKSVGYLTEKLI